MTIPAMTLTVTPLSGMPTAMLALPTSGLLGGVIPVLALIAVGVVSIALLRARRQVRPAPVPSSAAA